MTPSCRTPIRLPDFPKTWPIFNLETVFGAISTLTKQNPETTKPADKKYQIKMQEKNTTLKKVRFDEAANKQHESAYAYDAEDSNTRWYGNDDLKQFGYEVHKTGIAVQFKQQKDNVKSYANILTSIYLSCMEGKLPATKDFQLYVHWNRICPERRGIERYCVRNMNTARQTSTFDSNIKVLALQTKLVLERVPPHERTEKIKAAYKKQVQPARVFARIQGIADAAANKDTATHQEGRKRTVSNCSSDCSSPRLPLKKRKLNQEIPRSFSITPPSRQVRAHCA
jgi:hypothetical protein